MGDGRLVFWDMESEGFALQWLTADRADAFFNRLNPLNGRLTNLGWLRWGHLLPPSPRLRRTFRHLRVAPSQIF
jgi:hypothetical protein